MRLGCGQPAEHPAGMGCGEGPHRPKVALRWFEQAPALGARIKSFVRRHQLLAAHQAPQALRDRLTCAPRDDKACLRGFRAVEQRIDFRQAGVVHASRPSPRLGALSPRRQAHAAPLADCESVTTVCESMTLSVTARRPGSARLPELARQRKPIRPIGIGRGAGSLVAALLKARPASPDKPLLANVTQPFTSRLQNALQVNGCVTFGRRAQLRSTPRPRAESPAARRSSRGRGPAAQRAYLPCGPPAASRIRSPTRSMTSCFECTPSLR